eukprot:13525-Heterococcus_DN1.PRE.2
MRLAQVNSDVYYLGQPQQMRQLAGAVSRLQGLTLADLYEISMRACRRQLQPLVTQDLSIAHVVDKFCRQGDHVSHVPAPVNMRDDELVKALEAYAQARAEMRPSPINVMLPKSDMPLSTLDKLDSLCTRHQRAYTQSLISAGLDKAGAISGAAAAKQAYSLEGNVKALRGILNKAGLQELRQQSGSTTASTSTGAAKALILIAMLASSKS